MSPADSVQMKILPDLPDQVLLAMADRDAWVDLVRCALARAARGESSLSPQALGIPGMIDDSTRHLLNNLCAQGADYLEIGTLMGASVVAAAFDNTGQCWAVDDFSQWPMVDGGGAFLHLQGNPRYRQALGKPTRQVWMDHICGLDLQERVTLIEEDCFTFEPDFTVDVFYYDGDHSAQGTERALRRFIPLLRPSVLLIDDYRSPEVRLGVERAQLSIAQAWHCEPAWNGLLVAVLEHPDVPQV